MAYYFHIYILSSRIRLDHNIHTRMPYSLVIFLFCTCIGVISISFHLILFLIFHSFYLISFVSFHLILSYFYFYFISLPGHEDKPNIVKYHPSASGVLASSALDLTVKIWDINKAKALITLTGHTEQVG